MTNLLNGLNLLFGARFITLFMPILTYLVPHANYDYKYFALYLTETQISVQGSGALMDSVV